MTDDVIEISGLVKRFGSFTALDGLDLTVESQPGDTRFVVRLPLTERPAS